mgnify:CR=1 FL=1
MTEHTIINSEKQFCIHCMEIHDIYIVETIENTIFKDQEVEFKAQYNYCENTESYTENETQIKLNDLKMKDAYRQLKGLLTSDEIKQIRSKYNVSQKEFSEILGWGSSTIVRYENHQVQDRAHDDILRKIDKDASWYLEMLDRAKENINPKFFMQYLTVANELIKMSKVSYTFSGHSFKYIVNKIDKSKNETLFKSWSCSGTYNIKCNNDLEKNAALSCKIYSNIVPAA